ncbi:MULTISPECIES: helix-turn-helix domain-containing protein [Streptococcus]|jgi:XRE family transcriptional regulator|uniref:Transcriptional regulator n=2 Tax=Streptococcus TaxID=1301 RepID=R0MBJ1_STRMT|nr:MULTISPECIES: helix-turn-helix transcriptional regulator [Streptococcus]EOB32336.1 transcriptional regulator [Streptococcus mitis 13/39]MBZ2107411.1 helix-turn-helix domain-containing protein [Streptococcus mitis]QBX08916.1 DNA-binding protein [Streptococcus satellite phage Javan301]RSK21419.1 HTH-type transcriptional regulator Xre [Streptococcus oralis]
MNRLKELRQGKKLTQQELAQEIGVSKLTILNWEKGEHQIKSDKAQQLADFFEVPVGYLLGYDDYKTIQNDAFDSYRNMVKLLLTNPDFKNIISEYDETNRKNGKRDLSLFVKAESLPVIEQDIKDLILEEWKKTQPEDNYEEIDGTLSDNISRIYIALGQLPILFQDFFGSFLTLSKSDKKIVMQLVNSLYEKNKDIGIIKDYTDKK